jgi:hypothetical protein
VDRRAESLDRSEERRLTMNGEEILIPLAGMAIPIVIVPTVMAFRFAQRKREMEHAERMKALELGRAPTQDEPWYNPARIALSIGAGVPVKVFIVAWLASASIGAREEIWMGAFLVAVTSVICGSILAAKHFNQRAKAEAEASAFYSHKLAVDDDAYDVVSSRG